MQRASQSSSTASPARSTKATLAHQERTADEPREKHFHDATVSRITTVNERIRRLRFELHDPRGLNFLPGQWLDVFVPNVNKAGGFTITSSPRTALSQSDPENKPYFDLAIQKSPSNPPAAWLWRPAQDIEGQVVKVRVGGSFVFPPLGLDPSKIKRVVFIAGGVGINPMMSMLSHLRESHSNLEVRFLYSTRVPSRDALPNQVLFLPEILELFRVSRSEKTKDRLELFFTGTWDGSSFTSEGQAFAQPLMSPTLANVDSETEVPITIWTHRIDEIALLGAMGSQAEAKSTVFYVCGPPDMTDEIVAFLKAQESVISETVLCEKWW